MFACLLTSLNMERPRDLPALLRNAGVTVTCCNAWLLCGCWRTHGSLQKAHKARTLFFPLSSRKFYLSIFILLHLLKCMLLCLGSQRTGSYLVLSFYHVACGGQNQVIRLDKRNPLSLSLCSSCYLLSPEATDKPSHHGLWAQVAWDSLSGHGVLIEGKASWTTLDCLCRRS